MEPQGNRSLEGIRTYQEFKAATDREVYNQAEGFVRLGYLLRRAEDTEILAESGYKSVVEFARAEYGLTETYVSRYININKRYSEGGYSDRLMERFQGFGLAKLADMLTLPDEVVEALPVEATRAQIQEVKREVAQERQVSDLEILMEPLGGEEDILTKTLREYYRDPDKIGEYQAVHAALGEPGEEARAKRLYDAMAPAGNAVKMARVPGTGRVMVTIRGSDQKIELLNIRGGERGYYDWKERYERLAALFPGGEAESWEAVYGEEFPQGRQEAGKKAAVVSIAKAAVAPVQEAEPKEEAPESPKIPGKPTGEAKPKEQEIAPVQKEREENEAEPGAEEPSVGNGAEEAAESAKEKREPESRERQTEKRKEEDASRQQAVGKLKEEALERTEAIRTALEKGYYSMARSNAKKLFGLLEAIIRELDRKGVPGQMEIEELIGKETGEDEEDHMGDA